MGSIKMLCFLLNNLGCKYSVQNQSFMSPQKPSVQATSPSPHYPPAGVLACQLKTPLTSPKF